jgi:CheY-like chemotaxis protein
VVRAVLGDITARRNAEDELEQSRAHLQEAQTLEAVGRLAGGVAHNFNNLLQALLSLSALLRLHSTTHESLRIIDQIDLLFARGADLAQQLFYLQSHGGRIDVESAAGKGNLFRVFLPTSMPPSPVSVSETADTELIRGHGEQILLVEDEDVTRESLAELLELLGYSVRTARSGEEVLDLAPGLAPDLLLSDVLLPGIPGTVLAERLHARWSGMRVILMSGYTSDIVVPRGAVGEPVRFVRKPFEMAVLSRELRAALDSR